jgi:peptide/nickel transport system permease protein
MWRYLVRKLGHSLLILFIVSLFTAGMLDLAPGDTAYAYLGPSASPQALEQIHKDLDLDKPFVERYLSWVGNMLHGDLGRSYVVGAPVEAQPKVSDRIRDALPVTLEVVTLTMVLALVLAVVISMAAAYRAGGAFDRWTTTITSFLVAAPAFVTVPFLVFFLALQLGILPATGWVPLTQNPLENLRYAVLPAFSLALVLLPSFVAGLRDELVATLQEDFILNARAKGLPLRRIMVRHALRPSSFLLLAMSGLTFGALIGATVITETLFAQDGLGTLLTHAIQVRDFSLVQGVMMFIAFVYVAANTLVDIAYTYLDPRIRFQEM